MLLSPIRRGHWTDNVRGKGHSQPGCASASLCCQPRPSDYGYGQHPVGPSSETRGETLPWAQSPSLVPTLPQPSRHGHWTPSWQWASYQCPITVCLYTRLGLPSALRCVSCSPVLVVVPYLLTSAQVHPKAVFPVDQLWLGQPSDHLWPPVGCEEVHTFPSEVWIPTGELWVWDTGHSWGSRYGTVNRGMPNQSVPSEIHKPHYYPPPWVSFPSQHP